MEAKEQVLALCEVLYDKKAQDIVAIRVEDKTIISDWFVICSGRAVPQVKALCDEVEEKAPAYGLTLRTQGGLLRRKVDRIGFFNDTGSPVHTR